jgi:N-acyl-D-amino-acid deacylase
MEKIIIKNTKIVDGTGDPAFIGDISIKNSKITSIGKLKTTAEIEIDGSNLITCPGFIDPHSHVDFSFLYLPFCHNFIMQGITTAVGGNCGLSQAPKERLSFKRWLSQVERKKISINYVPLVGHNTIRTTVMGDDFKRNASKTEIEEMKKLVEEAMQSGAFGFSSGLDYDPSEYSNIEEIIELAKVAKNYGGIYTTHHRFNQSQWATEDKNLCGYGFFHGQIEEAWVGRYRGLKEAIEIGKKANIPVQISHLVSVYPSPQPHPGFLDAEAAKATLMILKEAIDNGHDISFDVIVSNNSIGARALIINEFLLTRLQTLGWLREFNKKEFIEQIKEKAIREKIKEQHQKGELKLGMIHTKADPYWMRKFKILICKNETYLEKTIDDIAIKQNKHPLDVIFDIIIEDPDTEWAQIGDDRAVNEYSLPVYLKSPFGMPCTDGGILPPVNLSEERMEMLKKVIPEEWHNALNIPIHYGMYANYIDVFVKKKKVLSLEQAIKKATSDVARRFGLKDRGILKPNKYADILIFDYNKIKMTGDFLNPRQAPEGIKYVLVNGQLTYKNNNHTNVKAGKILRHINE